MDPNNPHSQRAETVAEIARTYAYRRQHHVGHTGHTVRRLLQAVSALLGKPVTLADSTAAPPSDPSD
jgi:hypothetical protein